MQVGQGEMAATTACTSPSEATSQDAQGVSAEVRALRQVVADQQACIQQLLAGQQRLEASLAEGMAARPQARLRRDLSDATTQPGVGRSSSAVRRKYGNKRNSFGSIGTLSSSRSHLAAREEAMTLATLSEKNPSKRSFGSHGSRSHKEHNCLMNIVEHPAFEYLSAALIIMHSLAVGAYVEYLAVGDLKQHPVLKVVNLGLGIIFIGEVILKMAAERRSYFLSPDMLWNLFDIGLVVLLLVEFTLQLLHVHNVAFMVKIGEMIRTGRVLRILKCLRLSSTFQVIISKVFFSLKSLFWVLVLVFMLLYCVAVCIAQGVVDYLAGRQHAEGFDPSSLGETGHTIYEQFGSVEKTLYTLFQSITGGQLWGNSADVLGDVHEMYSALFIGFIALTTLSVLNIVTGIFVDATIMSAKHQRDEMMESERSLQEQQSQHLREVFHEIDSNGDGVVPMEEFQLLLQDENVRIFLQSMKIETSDLRRLFKMLDQDGSGEIILDEFVNGCMHLQGSARNFDVHRLLAGQRRLQRKFDDMADAMGFDRSSDAQPGILPEQSAETLGTNPGHIGLKVEV